MHQYLVYIKQEAWEKQEKNLKSFADVCMVFKWVGE